MSGNPHEVDHLPPEMQRVRELAADTLGDIEPAGPPRSDLESRGLFLASRTEAGRSLPPYYLVYFLFVDLLGLPKLGQWEKVAWAIPIRFKERLYSIEHRKSGVGIFAPTMIPYVRFSQKPTEEQELDAKDIALLIRRAVSVAEPYFQWRAENAAKTSDINVINKSEELFERYVYFRDKYIELSKQVEEKRSDRSVQRTVLESGSIVTQIGSNYFYIQRESKWHAQAAIDAFFSWTEHSFIHLAILLGRLVTGDDVAKVAEAEWKSKYKIVFDLSGFEEKKHYDTLLDLRAQIRNYMAHGSFGKRGQAFRFHSGAGAVPVVLTGNQLHRYTLSGRPAFEEGEAIDHIESFIRFLWSGPLAAARHHVFSELPSILSFALDGTYAAALQSEADMEQFVKEMTGRFEQAANMDW